MSRRAFHAQAHSIFSNTKKLEISARCLSNVGPPAVTLAQHYTDIGPTLPCLLKRSTSRRIQSVYQRKYSKMLFRSKDVMQEKDTI